MSDPLSLLGPTQSMSLEKDLSEVEVLKRENEKLQRRVTQLEVQKEGSVGLGAERAGIDIPYEELDMRDQIGGGGFSLVYRAMWRGTPVAVKKWFDPEMSDKVMQEFREEVMTMRDLKHPHCVQLIGACLKPPNLCIVMEYMPYSLHYILHQSDIQIDRKRCLNFALDMCRAFAYLHSRSPPVIHRDIKPGNFLVDRAYKLKLCDFGLCSVRNHAAGTPNYMAPELLEGKAYNEKVDVYAFGLLLWEMIAREVPFDGLSPLDIKTKVADNNVRPEFPMSCPRSVTKLIAECWDRDPTARPSFEEIIDKINVLLKET